MSTALCPSVLPRSLHWHPFSVVPISLCLFSFSFFLASMCWVIYCVLDMIDIIPLCLYTNLWLRHFIIFLGTAYGGEQPLHTDLLWKLRPSKRGSRSESDTNQTNYVKIKWNWQKPRGSNGPQSVQKVQGPDLDAQLWLWQQQEIKARAAQWIWEFLVRSIKELEVLLMGNKSYCAEVAHNVSSKNRRAIVEKQPSCQSQRQAAQQRKCIDRCVHIVFVLRP